ncbi:hypothetical protein [Allosphingosinicella deserti]|uniref:HTH cro/C1-type domain-containing protein n=1 Tax=Allosphingosinicella deserti TaxID=2116704 RepID=A0A2P7QQZ7_9SPHN|nr:hypothetical protein [Sphingomonas deserti]PSJ40370.1 hypothetical protein C7I55_08485 [Sphingomonas deserti]
MDWFERLTGFAEMSYPETRKRLEAADGRLHSRVNGRSYGIGALSMPSLAELRVASAAGRRKGRLKLGTCSGDVRQMHADPKNEGALFQVASQFNLLEMTGPEITPEDGVTRYQWDRTQGPACAMAAGAATIYRNYFAPIGDRTGQTADRQLDTLDLFQRSLAERIDAPDAQLWSMENGYALPSSSTLQRISDGLTSADPDDLDVLRACLKIGLHENVEVTDIASGPSVSQAFCSAMPVRYSGLQPAVWRPLACLVLEAAYEATLHAAAVNAARGGSNRVLLTRLGGGAFGNDATWIDGAIDRAIQLFADDALDIVFVSFSEPEEFELRLVEHHAVRTRG